jgi:hypothetical protein
MIENFWYTIVKNVTEWKKNYFDKFGWKKTLFDVWHPPKEMQDKTAFILFEI